MELSKFEQNEALYEPKIEIQIKKENKEELCKLKSDLSYSESDEIFQASSKPKSDNTNNFDNIIKNMNNVRDKHDQEKFKYRRSERCQKISENEYSQFEIQQSRQSPFVSKTKAFRSSLSTNKSNSDFRTDEIDNLHKELKIKDSKIVTHMQSIFILEGEIENLNNRNAKSVTELNEERELNVNQTYELFSLNGEIRHITAEMAIVKDNLDDLRGEYDDLEALYSKLKNSTDIDTNLWISNITEKDEEIENLKRLKLKNENILKEDVDYYKSKADKLTLSLKKEQEERMNAETDSNKIEELFENINALQQENNNLKRDLLVHRNDKVEFDLNCENYSIKLQKANDINMELQTEMERLKNSSSSQMKELENDIEDIASLKKILVEEKKSLRNRLDDCEEHLEELINENEEYQIIRDSDLTIISSLKNQIAAHLSSMQILQQENISLEKNLQISRAISKSSESSLTDLYEKHATEKNNFDSQIKTMDKTIQLQQQEKNQFNRSIRRLEQSKKEIAHQVEMSKANEEYLKSVNGNQIENIRKLKKTIMELEDEIDQLKYEKRRQV